VHANKAYWPHLGGVETVVRDLAEGALHHGHQVIAVSADGPGPGRVGGIEVKRSRSLGTLRSVPVSPTYPAVLLGQHGDVLHVHVPSVLPELTASTLGWIRRKRFGRLVVSWHSDVVRQRRMLRLVAPVLRGVLAEADVVLVATPHHLAVSPWLQAVEEKVTVVPFGVDPARYACTVEVAARAAQIRQEHGSPLVVFMGRLVYYKGIGRLLETAAALGDAHFIVVGDGPLKEMVLASAAARQGRLVLVPPVSSAEKVALLHACDVFVLPSTEPSEAFGIVQVEAMACGKPVITFDLPTGVTWVNQHLVTGLVAPLAEPEGLTAALQLILTDGALRSRLAAGALHRASHDLRLDQQIGATLHSYEA